MDKSTIKRYTFRLYVANHEAEAKRIMQSFNTVLETLLSGRYRMETIDVLLQPERAAEDKVFATPMLIRIEPVPSVRVLGDLSDPRKVLKLLGIEEASS